MMDLRWILLLVFLTSPDYVSAQYKPTWESLDARPLPAWYDKAKFGIFIHWGVFSVPSIKSEWFWWFWQGDPQSDVVKFMKDNYPPDFTYPDFAKEFTAELFDPDDWADILSASGAKYVVLTSKHHEGFTLWPSRYSWNWNAKEVGPKLDLVGDLAKSIRKRTKMHFGLYHSMFEWFHPLYLEDKAQGFKNGSFPKMKAIPELHEIVNTYKPEVIWSDGDWQAPDSYWTSKEFLAWLYNDSPVKDVVVTNDRWGANIACKHGGFYTCNDRYNPGKLISHKWENCMTIDKSSWGYRRNAKLSDYLSIEDLISSLASTISCGGNLLLNIGPTKSGRIIPIFEERLRQMGQWLGVNGEAVYESIPWIHQNDTLTPHIWYTSKKLADGSTVAYAFVLKWPQSGVLSLGAPTTTPETVVTMLGVDQALSWTPGSKGGGLAVILPALVPDQLPWSWVLKLKNLQPSTEGSSYREVILNES